MVTVSSSENLFLNDEFIRKYIEHVASIPLMEIEIPIRGNLARKFLEYVKDTDFTNLGFSKIVWKVSEQGHEINSESFEDELETILCEYI